MLVLCRSSNAVEKEEHCGKSMMKFVLKLVLAVLLFVLATEARSVLSKNSASYGEENQLQLHLSAPRSSEYQLQLQLANENQLQLAREQQLQLAKEHQL
ncbi:hypothetical protein DICVIV_13755 [Dictyocaulus viviparus]|uniref:Uncharacterized protein n=1 Tax=Dictyocaulus viviparus TaxID=29172 RepID=A0A0D8X9J9_DICVI|nr:hypothetical protein DICVIV_13755 [Dictyocaulus viviparus]